MQHELPILINFTVALLAAFTGGLLARRLKLPSMVGYMLAGVAIGPFTPGFSGDLSTIQQLAELGVICGPSAIPLFLGHSSNSS